MGRRYLFFTNECVGLGHLRRALSLTQAISTRDPEAASLIVTGAAVTPGPMPPRVDTITLPQLARDDAGRHHARRLGLGLERTHGLRAELALAAARTFAPAVAVVDKVPLGLGEELVPALEELKQNGCRIVLGLRDVEDSPEGVRRRWAVAGLRDAIRRLYDAVLVYGPARSPDAIRSLGWSDLGTRVHHVGYVGRPLPESAAPSDLPPRYLLVTTGGGADGFHLVASFLAAVRLRPLPLPTLVVTGPLMPEREADELASCARGLDVRLTPFRPDMDTVIARASAVVAMAGYNTVSELLRAGKPALLVPRVQPSSEQLVRAELLAAGGLAAVLRLDELSPGHMRAALDRLLEAEPPKVDLSDYDGAERAASILSALAGDARCPVVAAAR